MGFVEKHPAIDSNMRWRMLNHTDVIVYITGVLCQVALAPPGNELLEPGRHLSNYMRWTVLLRIHHIRVHQFHVNVATGRCLTVHAFLPSFFNQASVPLDHNSLGFHPL